MSKTNWVYEDKVNKKCRYIWVAEYLTDDGKWEQAIDRVSFNREDARNDARSLRRTFSKVRIKCYERVIGYR